jgi:Leucine-rich repeat (LRR) protein
MQAYIEKELKQRSANEITELLLDGCKSKDIVGLDDHDFEKLNHLSFIGCDLESLDGLRKLPEVRVLDLSENKISSLEQIPKFLPNLYHLNICGNPIKVSSNSISLFSF